MFVENNVKCFSCKKVFCCSDCRVKHEKLYHSEEEISCSICWNQQIVCGPSINPDVFVHISEKHLPLHCVKCHKIYNNYDDLRDASKCFPQDNFKKNEDFLQEQRDSLMTEHIELSSSSISLISKTELHKNPKLSNESNVENTPLAIKKVSFDTTNHLVHSKIENTQKGKVVRSTSTPMQGILSHKQFDASAGYVSSIYGSASDSDASLPHLNVLTPLLTPHPVHRINRLHKDKLMQKKQVTPLQHVMSKSIRRAITEHGVEDLNKIKRREMFNHSDSPLDLRTSPVLRRVQSEIVERSHAYENFDSSKTSTRKNFSVTKTTESILIHTGKKSKDVQLIKESNVYASCSRIEVINSTGKISQKNSFPFTPKVGGLIKKKTIFDLKTPKKILKTDSDDDDDSDIFYTPKTFHSDNSISNSKIASSKSKNYNGEYLNDIRMTGINDKENQVGSRLWSMVSSLLRIPSFNKNEQHQEFPTVKMTITNSHKTTNDKFLNFISSDNNNLPTLKRKREHSSDISAMAFQLNNEFLAKRPKRIQGRKPISSMRNLSID